MKFFEELKRRNVFRVAGAYAIGGWVLAQAAALLEAAYGMPGWIDTAVITVLLVGFPLVVLGAWFFEVTPQGIRLTRTVSTEDSITEKTGRKLDFAIVAGLGLVVVMLGVNAFTGRSPAPNGAPLGSSIAVLPFVDLSPQKDQEYFSDGVTEELLNSLARIKGLQVAGRTSSFAFKGDNRDLREIGSILAVDYILEGSIRKSGDQLRITAQLIKADDGFHAWSQTFDRQLTDVFALQDEITREIVDELSPFLPAAAAASAPKLNVTADMDAYELFLLARQKASNVATIPALLEAIELLDRVVEMTPDYAPAVAWRAIARLTYTIGSGQNFTTDDPVEIARADIDRAKKLDPNLPELYHAEGLYYLELAQHRGAGTLQQAITSFRKALEHRPSYSLARNDLALALSDAGDYEAAIQELQTALEHDPALIDANYNVTTLLSRFGRVDEAQQALDRWRRIDASHKLLPLAQTNVTRERGDLAEAHSLITAARQASPEDPLIANNARIVSVQLGEYSNLQRFAAPGDDADAALVKAFEIVGTGDRQALGAYVRQTPLLHIVARRGIRDFSYFLMIARDPEPVRDYYDLKLSAPGAFTGGLDTCYCSPIGLAWALRETRHPNTESVMNDWRQWLDANARQFAKASSWWLSNGDYALMRGDAKGALASYTKAVDFGHRGVALLPGERPMLPTTPDYKALQDRIRKLINAERTKLGWQPLQ